MTRLQSLLFAGGGTVNNFIKAKGINLDEYPNAIYASMPSGTALPLIAEEFNRHTKLKNNETLRFVSLILSADKAKKETMLKSCQESVFYNDACIVECYLGEDPMSVYISKKYANNLSLKEKGIIKSGELRDLLLKYNKNSQDTLYFYGTSKTSGTRERYNHFLLKDSGHEDIKDITKNVDIYNETDPNKYFKEPYVIMGSKYYHPLNISEDEYITYSFYDENNKPISKPIYLYFVAFKDEGNKTYYTIPERIFDFLMSIEITRKSIQKDKDYKERKINAKGLIEQLTKREDYIKE